MNATATIVEIPIKDLVPSKRNVRKAKPTKEEDAELRAGIRAVGLLQNLVVIQSVKPGIFEVTSGARRLKALQELTKEGHYTDTDKIPCQLRCSESENIEELGVMENAQRVKMHPADEFEAFRKMQRNGHTPQDIAMHMGVPESRVYKLLKLAAVAPRIIKAYRKSDLTLEAVMAFTIEDSKERQLEVFETMAEEGGQISQHMIRSALKPDDIETNRGKLAKFVGQKAYEKAGGETSTDLFREVVYFNDGDILNNLAIEKLNRAANKLSDQWNWTEISIDSVEEWRLRQITSFDTSETQPLIDKKEMISGKIDALQEVDEDVWDLRHEEQEDRLSAQYDKADSAIEASRAFHPEQMALSGCIVSIDSGGLVHIIRGVVHKSEEKALDALLNPNGSSDDKNGNQSTTKEPAEEDQSLSQALIDDLATYRTNIAKRFIADNIDVARDVLNYTVVVSALTDYWYNRPLDIRTTETRKEQSLTKPDDGKAPEEMLDNYKHLELDWLGIEDEADRFHNFSILSPLSKDALMAFAVAQSLHGQLSNQGGMSASLIESIYCRLDIPWHSYFKPTAENYLGRINKPALIKLGAQFLNEDWVEGAKKRSKKEIAVDLEDLFAGDNSYLTVTDEKRAEAIDWVPDGFKPPTEEAQP